MSQLIKKEKITIVIGTYEKDGQTKKKTRTIGELVTMQGDDGSHYQFGEMWGAGGCTKFNVYANEDSQGAQPPQQGGYAQQQPHMNQAAQNQQQGGYAQQQPHMNQAAQNQQQGGYAPQQGGYGQNRG